MRASARLWFFTGAFAKSSRLVMVEPSLVVNGVSCLRLRISISGKNIVRHLACSILFLAIRSRPYKNLPMFRLPIACLFFAFPAMATAERIWQPIIDYTISFTGDRPDAAPMINPFENFTHFASDFGWMGLGEERIDSKNGIIHVRPEGEWTGAWHSLAGLASQEGRTLDPTDLIGLGGPPEKRCGIRGLTVNASGNGSLRLELADIERKVVWSAAVQMDNEETSAFSFPIEPEGLGRIKFMNWIAEPGCSLKLSSIGFIAERPEISLEEWAFRISLGKLRRCHEGGRGMTRDRGHLPRGEFDSIASTGMQALGSALGAVEGMIDRSRVVGELRETLDAIRTLPTAAGFFPHFTHINSSGNTTIHPGTEFSTVDTAIALQSLLLAARILDLPGEEAEIGAFVDRLDFDAVTDSEGWISHGFLDDGSTPLEASWRDWGGETALVLALEAMVPGREPRGKMTPSGEIYRGIGFIAELQSLFYPDFDSMDPDLVTGITWPDARKNLLDLQKSYPADNWPESASARRGIFGLSAGETGMPGAGYTANGTEVMGVRWLHPHYMLMGLALSEPSLYRDGLLDLESARLLHPLGLPENVEVELRLHNPMQGSLNAAFETLAAYHGWRKRLTPENILDNASLSSEYLRKGAARFYPAE